MIVKPGLLATKTNKFCISSYCRIDALSLQPRRVQARKSRAHSTTYCYRRGLPAWSSPSQCFHATFQQCHSHIHAYLTRRLPPHLVRQSSTYLLMVANYTVVCPMIHDGLSPNRNPATSVTCCLNKAEGVCYEASNATAFCMQGSSNIISTGCSHCFPATKCNESIATREPVICTLAPSP